MGPWNLPPWLLRRSRRFCHRLPRPPQRRVWWALVPATSRNRPPDRTPTRRRWVPTRRRSVSECPLEARSRRSRKACHSQWLWLHGELPAALPSSQPPITYILPLRAAPYSSSSGSGNGAAFFHGFIGICAVAAVAKTRLTIRASNATPRCSTFDIEVSFRVECSFDIEVSF